METARGLHLLTSKINSEIQTMTLEKKLVRLRKKEDMSQADVSEKLNVSRQAVSRWEAGDSRPSTENLQALCKLYIVLNQFFVYSN